MVKNLPDFYGTRMCNSVTTSVHCRTLTLVSLMQSTSIRCFSSVICYTLLFRRMDSSFQTLYLQWNVSHIHDFSCLLYVSPYLESGPGYLIRYSDLLRAGRLGGRIPLRGESFRTRSDRPWGPPNLLYNGYRVIPVG